jgi:hypothetical protein
MKEDKKGSEKYEQREGAIWRYLPTLTLSLLFIGVGLYLLIGNLIIVGTDARYPQPTANGGEMFLIVGLIFLIVTYFSLSPFSRLRQCIEGKTKLKKRK